MKNRKAVFEYAVGCLEAASRDSQPVFESSPLKMAKWNAAKAFLLLCEETMEREEREAILGRFVDAVHGQARAGVVKGEVVRQIGTQPPAKGGEYENRHRSD